MNKNDQQNSPDDSLGLIAGSRSLPLTLARLARRAGVRRLVAVAFTGETDASLADVVDEIVWLRVGQLVKLIDAFKSRGVQRCVMAGQIAPKHLFDVRPDLRALTLLLKLRERNARTVFAAIANELQADGIKLVEATPWLDPIMPDLDYSVGPRLSVQQWEDVSFGWRIAKEIARLDIGQVVVVRRGTVLAVEGFEGTDACLRRGGELAGKNGGAVAIKLASEQHDFRFDIPCIGPQTIQTCAEAGISVLAVEAKRTLLLEKEELESRARKEKISVISQS